MFEIDVIETSSLGDRSYLAHDGEVAVVIDPQRDIDRVLDLAAGTGCGSRTCWRPTCTTTTSPAASSSPAAPGATGLPGRQRRAVRPPRRQDGDVVEARADAAAGAAHPRAHPPPRQLRPAATRDGRTQAVFTGGSMLYGATGRTDLVGPEHTVS